MCGKSRGFRTGGGRFGVKGYSSGLFWSARLVYLEYVPNGEDS